MIAREKAYEILMKQELLLVDTWETFFKHGKATVKCIKCNQIFKKKIAAAKTTGCLICASGISEGEETIAKYLNEVGISYKREYKFKDCKDKNLLPFDFALFDKDKVILLIEFDGRQHFESIEYFGGKKKLEEQQKRDDIKNNYCLTNGIPLLRIHYKKLKSIHKILELHLIRIFHN
jgi:hypothetical protein